MKIDVLARALLIPFVVVIGGYAVSYSSESTSDDDDSDPVADSITNIQERRSIQQGETGVGLFTVNVPGETFSALESKIGHQAVDLSLKGNGLLRFDLIRKFEDIPSTFPYAFGNMSIVQPKLLFRVRAGFDEANAPTLDCSQFTGQWSDNSDIAADTLFNDIVFKDGGKAISLLPRSMVNSVHHARYPANAIMLSKDNYYLSCEGNKFAVFAPDGRKTIFNPQTGMQHHKNLEYYGIHRLKHDRETINFRSVEILATSVHRLNSKIRFTYEPMPTIDLTSRDGLIGPEHLHRVVRIFNPVWGAIKDAPNDNILYKAKRLRKVELFVADDQASGATTKHTLNLGYSGNTGECPGVIKRAVAYYNANGGSDSNATGVGVWVDETKYDYSVLSDNELGHKSTPRSGCLLESVSRAHDSSSHPVGAYTPLWGFEYGVENGHGLVDSLYYRASKGSKEFRIDWQNLYTDHFVIPLKSVVVPTGAKAIYEYYSINSCLNKINSPFQRFELCNDHLALRKRFVQGAANEFTQNTTFIGRGADADPSLYSGDIQTLFVTLATEGLHQRLRFGLKISHGNPVGALDRTSAIQLIINDSGRLLSHEIVDNDAGNGSYPPAIIKTKFTYQEFGAPFPKAAAVRPYPDYPEYPPPSNPPPTNWGAGIQMARWEYMRSHRNINLYREETTVDGYKYKKEYTSFDDYNFPTTMLEWEGVPEGSDYADKRHNVYAFEHGIKEGGPWNVGRRVYHRTTGGYQYALDGTQETSKSYRREYAHDKYGLLRSESKGGVLRLYHYHNNGNLKSVSNGRGDVTEFKNYKLGIAQIVDPPGPAYTTRVVDNYGNTTTSTERVSGDQTVSTQYVFDEPFNQLSKIIRPGSAKPVLVTQPRWRVSAANGGNAIRKYIETVAGYRQDTKTYDSLGRLTQSQAYDAQASKSRFTVKRYDNLGRLKFESAATDNRNTDTGTTFSYDKIGRIDTTRRQLRNSVVGGKYTFCYQDCGTNTPAVGRSTVITDPLGFKKTLTYRAFGSPGNRQLVGVQETVDANSVVNTLIDRNYVGMITRITQSGDGDAPLSRIFKRHEIGGYVTAFIKAEMHPEFGVKETAFFDPEGLPRQVKNFDGSTATYLYDNQGRLIEIQPPAETGGAAGITNPGIQRFTYYDNGWPKSVHTPASDWEYHYNDNGLLEEATLSAQGQTFTTMFRYNTRLAVDQITYPSGLVVSVTPNGFGEAISVGEYVTNVDYHPNGSIGTLEYGNGAIHDLQLDWQQRLDRLTVTGPEGSNQTGSWLNLNYEYTARDNVKSISNYFHGNGGSKSALSDAQYDGMNRLTQVTGSWGTVDYDYDAYGNILSRTMGADVYTYDYDVNGGKNRLNSYSGGPFNANRSFTYDGNGNIIGDSIRTLRYDHLNQLVNVINLGKEQSNQYDANGHRYRTTIVDEEKTQTKFSVYLPDGRLFHELDVESGETRDHIYVKSRVVAVRGKHNNHDTDADGLPDYYERRHGFNAHQTGDQLLDDDGDGVSNLEEYQRGLLPTDADSNGDGQPDAPVVLGDPVSYSRLIEPVITFQLF